MKVLLTGIQPTNQITLANYLGAIKPLVDFQNEYKSIIFIADLHARTVSFDKLSFNYEELKQFSKDLVNTFIACGVDISKTDIFIQSHIPQHLELFYFLLTHSSLGELKRMTQYKFLVNKLKEPNQTDPELMGILLYPVLMAADILLYDADLISVGQDQEQHLELARTIAKRINNCYKKKIFNIPIPLQTSINLPSIRIMDLQEPTKKMSKSSSSGLGTIFLKDSKNEIFNKFLKAKTDSVNIVKLDYENQPGIYNLLLIYSSLKNIKIEEAETIFRNSSYYELKIAIANLVFDHLSIIQEKLKNIDEEKINKYLIKNTEKYKDISKLKMSFIYENLQ